MRDWNYRHQTAGVENAGPSSYGKPKHLWDWNCHSSSFMFPAVKLSATVNSSLERYIVVSEILTVGLLYAAFFFFHTPLLFRLKFGGVPIGRDP